MPDSPSDFQVLWERPSEKTLALARELHPGCHVMANSYGVTVITPGAMELIQDPNERWLSLEPRDA